MKFCSVTFDTSKNFKIKCQYCGKEEEGNWDYFLDRNWSIFIFDNNKAICNNCKINNGRRLRK